MMTNDHDTFFLHIRTVYVQKIIALMMGRAPMFPSGYATVDVLQLTDFFVLLIKAIRQHRAPHPYRFDSVTVSSRVFLRVV